MACARGCCPTPRDHYRSLVVSRSKEDRAAMTKTTTHQTAPDLSVDVTEHYHDRQDVTVHAPRLHVTGVSREVRD